jgi:hypothetical protein
VAYIGGYAKFLYYVLSSISFLLCIVLHNFIRDSKFHDKEFDNVMQMRSIYQKSHVNCAAAQTQERVLMGKTRIP